MIALGQTDFRLQPELGLARAGQVLIVVADPPGPTRQALNTAMIIAVGFGRPVRGHGKAAAVDRTERAGAARLLAGAAR
jgi:hypothetical protein